MKKFAVFFTIMAICGGTYGASTNLYKQQIIVPADNTRVILPDISRFQFHKENTPLNEYTIDKRKYVLNTIEPFSAVVGLQDWRSNWCSGTLTEDGIIVTAKHCIFDGYNNTYKDLSSIIINYQNTNIGVKQRTSSGVNIYPDGEYNNTYDWALLVPNKDIKSRIKVSDMKQNTTTDVIEVGYGALKILSDQEIRKIRTEYAKWLNQGIGTNVAPSTGTDLRYRSTFGKLFIADIMSGKISGIPANIFHDTDKLKASFCRATTSNARTNEIGCQMWGGNSGGPVFYKHNNQWYLYGTHVSGYLTISDNKNEYAKGAHMVPINMFIKSYRELVSKLKGAKQ